MAAVEAVVDQPFPTHYRVCNYCEAMCGVRVSYDEQAKTPERKIRVHPDRLDTFSKGSMCPKAAALGPLHFDPERLRHPHKRVGDQWQRISWPEAYDEIETQLKRIRYANGADAIAAYLGNPIVHNLGMMLFIKPLMRAIGTRNVFSATSMDQLPHHFAAQFMFGHEFRIPVPDIDRTDFMIIMGANPLASNGSIMTSAGVRDRLCAIQKRGGKVVVIDPRKTETAAVADEHLFIKPAGDLYFLLAFLQILLRDGRGGPGRLQAHVSGDQALQQLVNEFDLEQLAQQSSIALADIERLVADFYSRPRAVLYGRMGLCTQPHGGLNQWLVNCINLLSGNFDRAGGMMFPTPAIELAREPQKPVFGRWHSAVRGMKEFAGELPVSAMTDELLAGEKPDSVAMRGRAFISICGNPVLSSPDGKRLDQTLENVGFMLSIDNYINETTRHAHLILPTPSGLEIDHYDLVFNTISVGNNAKFSPALFPPGKDRPYDWQVLKELMRRLSPNGISLLDRITTPRRLVNWGLLLGAYGKLSSPKRWFNGLSLKQLLRSPHGVSLGPLQPRVPQGLLTPDKKIHLAPEVFLQRLRAVKVSEFQHQPLTSHDNDPGLFSLIGRRNVNTNNSWMHQVKKLSRSKQVRCTAMMHPQDATVLSLNDGEIIRVHSDTGAIDLPLEITDSMMRGVLSIPHGFGHHGRGTRISHAESIGGVSVNDITDSRRVDALTGNAAFSGLSLRVEKISRSQPQQIISGKPVLILYASQSGNAEMVARELAQMAPQFELLPQLHGMHEVDVQTLAEAERLLLVVSTFGEGDMPDNAAALWQKVNTAEAPSLEHSHYALLALGDSGYDNFCAAGMHWDERLTQLGASRLLAIKRCDVDYADEADRWVQQVLPLISGQGDQTMVTATATQATDRAAVYNRQNPMQATLLRKIRLSGEGSGKQTMHYEFELSSKAPTYQAGDALYLLPKNRRELVEQWLTLLERQGDETLREQLQQLEIRLPSSKSLQLMRDSSDSPLQGFDANSEAEKVFLYGRDMIDLLQMHPHLLQQQDELIATLPPLQARAYSISSSPQQHLGQVHLTVATVRYQSGGREHHGVSSGYLADVLQPSDTVDCYFVANQGFSLPADGDTAIIMVGPGTGVAPFRAFLHEREALQQQGDNWLFFGDRNQQTDFLYRDELVAMRQSGLLTRLDLAFSRDQADRIYVQQRMHEQAGALYRWLQDGAYFYVCGDAAHMAADVDRALHEIIAGQGGMTDEQAADYVQKLKDDKRYVRDVY